MGDLQTNDKIDSSKQNYEEIVVLKASLKFHQLNLIYQ